MNMTLQEIIWELTLNCNKDCNFCGSKDILNSHHEITDHTKLLIVDKILEYPPNEMVLSGGEPCIDPSFIKIVKKFGTDIKLKVLTNGTLFHDKYKSILPYINQIGLSINTNQDMEEKHLLLNPNNVTMITNFGTHNIWELKNLYTYFKVKNISLWQIQLTMGKYQLPADGIAYLRKQLKKINDNNIVIADNLQVQHVCSAGLRSLSILSNGDITSCLSKRSWDNNLKIEGNIITDDLKEVWESKFKDERFTDNCKCCRDCIDFPNLHHWEKVQEPLQNNVFVYGVAI